MCMRTFLCEMQARGGLGLALLLLLLRLRLQLHSAFSCHTYGQATLRLSEFSATCYYMVVTASNKNSLLPLAATSSRFPHLPPIPPLERMLGLNPQFQGSAYPFFPGFQSAHAAAAAAASSAAAAAATAHAAASVQPPLSTPTSMTSPGLIRHRDHGPGPGGGPVVPPLPPPPHPMNVPSNMWPLIWNHLNK